MRRTELRIIIIKHFGKRGPSRSRHGCATLTATSAVHRWLGFLPLVRDAANASAAPRHVEVIGEAPHVLSGGGCDSDRDHGVRPGQRYRRDRKAVVTMDGS